ncbi:MAG TPA: response regulator, partial [Streptosporangiaceae bacterium]|nr:response regulator [Streptosporangiaceae bacterium]
MARILVVDDLATMRDLIKRVLGGSGYEVDVAASVEQARAMKPASYDVLLIDEHLGEDRGTDLIASLADQDPAAPRRCVLITGGLTGAVPDGATVLAKPFDPAGLRQLVDSVARGGGNDSQASPSNTFFGEKNLRGLSPSGQIDSREAQNATPGGWRLAELISMLRAHDYAVVADLIHDGPVQELGASILALELIRRAVPADLAGKLDEVIGWLV